MQKIYCVFLNSSKEFVKIVSSPTAKYGCVIKYVFVHIGTMMSKIFLQKDMAVLMTAHRTLDIGHLYWKLVVAWHSLGLSQQHIT